ncbi:hypothetical protein [Streptomyces sp. NPDC020983]|uniref:hypothetical protein n=1 Tax=Streptomyces sp. NPDC020983 TaxID=3365106 RepID=UPI0037BA3A18
MPEHRRGKCRVCGRTYQLTANGLIRRHWARSDDGTASPGLADCSGSQREPADGAA